MSAKRAREKRQLERAAKGGLTAAEWQREREAAALHLEQRLARKAFDSARTAAQRLAALDGEMAHAARRMKNPMEAGLRLTTSTTNRLKRRNDGDV